MFRSYFTAAAIALAFTSTVGVGAAVVEKSLWGRNADADTTSANKHHHRVLQEEEEFTFLIADIQYEDGITATSRKLQGNSNRSNNPNKPERTMNVQDGNGMIYEIAEGSGDTAGASSGSKVTLPDKAFMNGKGKINLGGGALKKKTKKPKKKRDLQVTAIGTKTVVAVRVIAIGASYNKADEAGLSDDVFGTNGDAYNL
eukprot:scaffold13153_cov78-Skeletonema_dohrnii-CCMP3373.AAC.1